MLNNKDIEDPLWWAERISEAGMFVGGSVAMEHRLHYGRWYDEGELICHGKIGIGVFAISLIARIGCAIVHATRPKCPYCNNTLAYIPRYQSFYCNTCQEYFQYDD